MSTSHFRLDLAGVSGGPSPLAARFAPWIFRCGPRAHRFLGSASRDAVRCTGQFASVMTVRTGAASSRHGRSPSVRWRSRRCPRPAGPIRWRRRCTPRRQGSPSIVKFSLNWPRVKQRGELGRRESRGSGHRLAMAQDEPRSAADGGHAECDHADADDRPGDDRGGPEDHVNRSLMSAYAAAISPRSAASSTATSGRILTCRMNRPVPSRRPDGSGRVAPRKKPTFTCARNTTT